MANSQGDLCHSRILTDSPGSLISEVDYVDPEETAVLSSAVCRQTKYGSTSSHTFHNQTFITHVVMPADTLQGIALKYSVTMEQIRRANRLFPSDTLFCKSVLSIPVPRVKEGAAVASLLTNSDSSRHPDSSSDTESEGISYNNSIYNSSDDLPFAMNSSSASISLTRLNGSNHSRLKVSKKLATTQDSPEETANDFLSRIDNSIAKSKDQMASALRTSQSQYNLKPSSYPRSTGPSRSQSMGLSTSPLNESATDEMQAIPPEETTQDQLPSLSIRPRESKVHYSKKRSSANDTIGNLAL